MRVSLVLLTLTSGAAFASADGIPWTNGMPTTVLLFNSLSANPEANPRMVAVPLSTASYDLDTGAPALREQLLDPKARVFFDYLVSCALGPSQEVRWSDKRGHEYAWRGAIGVCPEWGSGPASAECQQWVSACLLARINPTGKRVQFSGRGYHPTHPEAVTPAPRVRTDPYPLLSKQLESSAEPCQSQRRGVHRNCGFQLEYVGKCTPGQIVHVGAGGVPPGAPGSPPLGQTLAGRSVLRACTGLQACGDASALASSEGTFGTTLPALSFMCPEDGAFSLLSGPYDSTQTTLVAPAAVNATYPASESSLFTLREGTFFGNLFGQGSLAQGVDVHVSHGVLSLNVPPVVGSIYTRMFSCSDPSWDLSDAMMMSRLCAVPGLLCAAQYVGACDAPVVTPSYTGPRCVSGNFNGSGGFGPCMTPSGTFLAPTVTSYLHPLCGTGPDATACVMMFY